MPCFCIFVRFPYQEKRPEFENNRRGRNGGTNSAIPHMIAREYRNIAPKFSQIPKPQLQMEKRLTLSILQILLSNRNNTFMSVFPSQGASKSSVR